MNKFTEKFPRSKIQTRLIAYYVIFAILTVAGVAYFAYTQAARSLRSTVEDKLETVAELKVDFLDQWVDEQRRNAILLASLPELREQAGQLLNDDSDPSDRRRAREELTQLVTLMAQRTADFQDVQILDRDGIIVISASRLFVGLSQFGQTFFIEGQSRTYTQRFYDSDLFGKTTLTVATPLFDERNKWVGVLALHFNMRQVDSIIRDDPQLNEPTQSFLITPHRTIITDDPLILNRASAFDSPAIRSALEGNKGAASYLNHDGVAVIGRYMWIENQNAALIVEINEEVALGPARRLALNILLLGFFVSVGLVVIVVFLAQRITAPLRSLTETAARISAGDLEATASVLSDDEVGALAQAFNSMTEKLHQTLAGLQGELRERRQAEADLLQFRKMMDETNEAIFLIDPETSDYVDFNRSAHERLGYTREELIQMRVMEVAQHLPSMEIWRERVDLVRAQGHILFETAYRRKDGTTFPVEVSVRMLDSGDRELMVALARDVTERRKSELALRESEEKFRKVFHSSPVAICITTLAEGRLLEANYAYWDLTGYDPDTSIGRDAEELNMWDVPEERLQFVQNLRAKKSLFNPDDYFYHVDGSIRHVISFYELIRFGEADCVLAMFYDMSAQKRTMQALQQSEARTRALLEAIPDLIFEFSADGTFLKSIQPSSKPLFLAPEQFIGKQVSEVLPESVAEKTLSAIQRVLRSEKMETFEYQLSMSDDVMEEYEARIVANSADSVLAIVRDITQRKWADTEREKLIRELEIRNRESETLRNSLASIVTTFDLDEVVERILDQIKLVIPYDTASVWRVDDEWQTLMLSRDLPPEISMQDLKFRIDFDNSSRPLILGEKAYVLNNNVQEELPDFQGPHAYINSWLAVPLKKRGRIIGLIALDGRQRDQFTEHHAELAVTFANQVAIAFENADLFNELQNELSLREQLIEELEEKNAEAETMRESLASIVGTLELAEIIQRILDQIRRVVPYDSASVWRLEGNRQILIGGRDLPSELSTIGLDLELDETNHAMPIFNGERSYIISHNVQADYPQFQEPPHDYINSWLGVPLRVRGHVSGLIALDGRQMNQFNEHHAHLAVTFADQVAIAIANANLFERLQKELKEKKSLIAELESKNAELERFTYTVSHDLKSPLFTIRGFLGYLEQDALAGKHDRVKADMQRIVDATEKMQMLLNDLLELSRVGRLKNESVNVPFEALVREAIELVQGRIMERGVVIQVKPDLPTVYGDRPRLVEVLQNLIDNAAKFMGAQKEPRIEIGQSGEEAGKPILYVRDNGLGIAAEHFERVFGLFNKLDVKSEGTGIGLALVKRIIEVHEGRIWVESEAGQGATFYFTLPPSFERNPDGV